MKAFRIRILHLVGTFALRHNLIVSHANFTCTYTNMCLTIQSGRGNVDNRSVTSDIVDFCRATLRKVVFDHCFATNGECAIVAGISSI